jgi:hypothetical protein
MEAEQLAEDGLSGRAVAQQRLNRSMDDRSMDDRSMDQLVAEFQPVDELDDSQKDSIEAIALVEGTARSSYACFLNLGLLGVQATLDDTTNIRDLRIYTAGLGGAGLTGRSLQRSLLVNAQTLSSSILDAAYTYTSEVHLPGPQHTPELEEPPPRAQTPVSRVGTRVGLERSLKPSFQTVPIIAVQQETPSTAQKPLQALQQSTLAFNRTKGQSIIGSLSKIVRTRARSALQTAP